MTTYHVGQPPQAPPTARKPRWPLYAGIAAAVLLLAGGAAVAGILTARHDNGTPTSPASSPAAPVKLDSPQAIAQRLADLGAACGRLVPITNPLGATARASCYIGDDEVVISTYASRADAENQWDLQSTTLAGISDVDMVIGDGWTISADDPAYAVRAAALLGGVYRHAG